MGNYGAITNNVLLHGILAAACMAACHGGSPASDLESVRQAVGPGPDVTVESVTAPYSAQPSSGFDVQVSVCNRGDSYESGLPVNVVLSWDGDISNQDMWIGSGSTGSLDPGACETSTIPVSAGQPDGAYFVGAIVDPDQFLSESDESNNALSGGALLLGYDPELRVTAVSAPRSAQPGDDFQTQITVCNHGQSATIGSTDVRLLLSDDAVIDEMTDYHVTQAPIDSLEIGACQSLVVDGYASAPAGTYYLGVIVDPDNYISELDESNNTHGDHRMGVGWQPNIHITTASSPVTMYPGGSFEVEFTACNDGTSDASSISFEFYLSDDDNLTTMDDYAGSAWLSDLPAGTCQTTELPAWASTPEGVYRFGIFADPMDNLIEFFEDDNLFVGTRLGVGDDAELSVTAIDSPTVAELGTNIEIPVTVCNDGQSMSDGTQVELFVSDDPDPTTYSDWFGSHPIPDLQPDTCATVQVSGYLNGPGGLVYPVATVDPFDQVIEIMEDNNQLLGQGMGVGDQAELVITQITGPPSGQSGQQMEFTVTACNIGFAPASYAHIDVVLSSDATIDLDTDDWLGANSFQDLQPGQCSTLAVSGYASIPDGVYTVGAGVNRNLTTAEILYSNNIVAGHRLGIGNKPDLVVENLSAPPTARQGDYLEVTLQVCNNGQSDNPGGHVDLVLSGDSSIDLSDPLLGGQPIDILSPGQCSNSTVSGYVSVPDGLYTVGAIISGAGDELIDDNNSAAGSIVGIGDDPDLRVTAVSGPSTALPYSYFDTSVTLCNQGQSLSSNNNVDIYLSDDGQLSMDDLYAGLVSFGDLSPGQCSTVQYQANGADSGEYQLIAHVDPWDSVLEIFEDNNTHVGESVAFGNEPDLMVTSITSPLTAAPSTDFPVDIEVCNHGQSASFSSDVQLFLSEDSTIDPYDDSPAGWGQAGYLDIGDCTTVNVIAQSWFGSGVYTLGAIVDMSDSQPEIRENNNTFVGQDIGLGYDPELRVVSVSGPPSALPYSSFNADITVCNDGQAPSSSSDVELYLSSDDVLDAQDSFVGMSPVANLSQGACTSVQVPASGSVDTGRYTLIAVVDPYDSTPEILEGNNEFAGDAILFGSDPDLTITSVSAPASAMAYSPINVDVTLCNDGQSTSYNNDLEVYLSSDPTVDNLDLPIGGQPTGQLDPGQCTFVTISAYVNDPGTFHLGVIADPYNYGVELDETNNIGTSGTIDITP